MLRLVLALLLLTVPASAQFIPGSGGGGGGSGTVTSLSVATANGFAGTVATATTTPAITLTTTVTGNVCSNATALSACTTTGTGSTVLQTTPTLITPVLGIANGTSLVLGGATIGTNALAVTGTSIFNSNVSFFGSTLVGNGSTIQSNSGNMISYNGTVFAWSSLGTISLATSTFDTGLSRNAAGIIQFSTTAANAAGAWLATNGTLSGALVISGTADASAVTGSGALQVAGGASIAKRLWIPAITASAGLQTAVLCQSSGGEMIADSVACLASSERFKTILGTAENGALDKIIRLPIHRWKYNEEGIFKSDEWTRERIGPTAEETAAIDPRLVGYGSDGKIRNISTEQLLALTIQAIQELKADNDKLRTILIRRSANGG